MSRTNWSGLVPVPHSLALAQDLRKRAVRCSDLMRAHALMTSPVTSWTFGWTWTYDRTVPLRLQLNEKLAGGEELGAFDGLLFASLGG